MLSEEALEKLGELISQRIESLNTYMLKQLGEQIAYIGSLTPSQAMALLQSIKYGNDLQKITKELARITKLTEKDIYDIFDEVAQLSETYSIPYYEYKKIKHIPYKQNIILQRQVKALASVMNDEFKNMLNTSAFMTLNSRGERVLTPIGEIYQNITEQAVLSVNQGREAYTEAIRKATSQLAKQGIQQVDYSSGYHRRLDSAVRMNVLEGIKRLNQTMLNQFGEEFGADGVEVSHHINSAPDHIDTVDGKQFTKEEYEEINNKLDRPVGTLNCYHFAMPIVIGVNKPLYSKEELIKDKQLNEDGFEYEGVHYTNYEGTQLQRKIETAIRKAKDEQIFEVSLGEFGDPYTPQKKITQLTRKYNQLCKISGLKPRIERLKVEGYKKI